MVLKFNKSGSIGNKGVGVECSVCGAVLSQNAKFCDQCGKKVVKKEGAKAIQTINKCNSDKEKTYGQVMGYEKWLYYGAHNHHYMRQDISYREIEIALRQAYYDGKFYYIDRDYVWQSDTDGTDKKIIMKSNGKAIFVNSYGIYIKINNEIKLYDFSGIEIGNVSTSDEIKSYYICNDKVFLITRNEILKKDCAFYYDMSEGSYHSIFEGSYKDLGEKQKDCKGSKGIEINYIMANEKRVVMWMEFYEYYYPDNDEEDIYESEIAGWYSYEFTNKKLISLNWVGVYPHELAKKGVEAFVRHLRTKGISLPLAERKNFFRIAFFNMEKDLMWTVKAMDNGGEIWESRKIGSMKTKAITNDCPSWIVPKVFSKGMYFDGVHRIQKESDFALYSYDCNGKKSENWIAYARHEGPIRVCGEYIFVNSDEKVPNCNTQFKLQFQPGSALRINWMVPSGVSTSEKEKSDIIDSFEHSDLGIDKVDDELFKNIVGDEKTVELRFPNEEDFFIRGTKDYDDPEHKAELDEFMPRLMEYISKELDLWNTPTRALSTPHCINVTANRTEPYDLNIPFRVKSKCIRVEALFTDEYYKNWIQNNWDNLIDCKVRENEFLLDQYEKFSIDYKVLKSYVKISGKFDADITNESKWSSYIEQTLDLIRAILVICDCIERH